MRKKAVMSAAPMSPFVLCTALSVSMAAAASTHASLILNFTGPSGLSAVAEFTLLDPTTVMLRLQNTSTGYPIGFTAADQLLTGISWDAGAVGVNAGDPNIVGGTIVTGPTSFSLNFSVMDVGPGENIGGEWGYGNNNGSGLLANYISGNTTGGITPFGGPNLDGPVGLNGPQAGLMSAAFSLPLGGIGAIQDELIATFTLSQAITSLNELLSNGARVEFGSSAYFIDIPAPSAIALFLLWGLPGSRRRR
jgi:hypothetical protein